MTARLPRPVSLPPAVLLSARRNPLARYMSVSVEQGKRHFNMSKDPQYGQPTIQILVPQHPQCAAMRIPLSSTSSLPRRLRAGGQRLPAVWVRACTSRSRAALQPTRHGLLTRYCVETGQWVVYLGVLEKGDAVSIIGEGHRSTTTASWADTWRWMNSPALPPSTVEAPAMGEAGSRVPLHLG